ncbi:hypothetical protein TRM7557_01968 [Tritonibacter multivorans]|uniref:MOSC domain-containing protein n=1 Tax=Tritonibacter multivorans TaxID=928856 RepID=A0A0P1GU25_9RHOB|nr:hypothetical protein [Tritonibacter multivorans]MDA7422030.1 hypothetical protein [Tritonibacter multivorans]CUH78627.1 hypothetical protein TRM7557_01968 [Tritonibacter multivorans]SFD67026.1 hypothetical protein SAMN04488049_12040 [Tritonibacter multivorans]
MNTETAAFVSAFATRAECDAALPYILDAPKDDVAIETLCFRPGYGERSFPERIQLSVARGIEGERWGVAPWLKLADGSGDPRIQVSILPKRIMDLCWRDRVNTPHPGDTMVADIDVTEDNMPVGTRLQIGSAVIEVSDKFNTACIKWKERYGGKSLRWLNHRPYRPLRLRGILCRVVQDGEIRATDRIRKQA